MPYSSSNHSSYVPSSMSFCLNSRGCCRKRIPLAIPRTSSMVSSTDSSSIAMPTLSPCPLANPRACWRTNVDLPIPDPEVTMMTSPPRAPKVRSFSPGHPEKRYPTLCSLVMASRTRSFMDIAPMTPSGTQGAAFHIWSRTSLPLPLSKHSLASFSVSTATWTLPGGRT
ncbi:hypothetical protein CIPLJCMA_00250 [Klebsiella phage 066026]|nr:hypothetical protein CIPLJCMA_00250 [Klebsiella phage 066026]